MVKIKEGFKFIKNFKEATEALRASVMPTLEGYPTIETIGMDFGLCSDDLSYYGVLTRTYTVKYKRKTESITSRFGKDFYLKNDYEIFKKEIVEDHSTLSGSRTEYTIAERETDNLREYMRKTYEGYDESLQKFLIESQEQSSEN